MDLKDLIVSLCVILGVGLGIFNLVRSLERLWIKQRDL
jgi:ABC-type nitrate/sulfonate/bicarbonate transport system permease component